MACLVIAVPVRAARLLITSLSVTLLPFFIAQLGGGIYSSLCASHPATTAPWSFSTAWAEPDRHAERARMVRELQQHGSGETLVTDPRVLAAMAAVPRHQFVPASEASRAYADRPLAIGMGQTISQPYIVALMTQLAAVEPGMKVLEVGTGSGYQAAILAQLTDHVYSIEIIVPLAVAAQQRFARLGLSRIVAREGDGYFGWQGQGWQGQGWQGQDWPSKGWPEKGWPKQDGPEQGWSEQVSFDRILVTAAARHIPPPLLQQLKPGGRMVIPVGPKWGSQRLLLVLKDDEGKVSTRSLLPVVFVPLTGGR